jgi:hypothetical protein
VNRLRIALRAVDRTIDDERAGPQSDGLAVDVVVAAKDLARGAAPGDDEPVGGAAAARRGTVIVSVRTVSSSSSSSALAAAPAASASSRQDPMTPRDKTRS